MKTFIKKVFLLAALITLIKTKNKINRPLGSLNFNLNYNNLLMEYYYFGQKCNKYFEDTRLLGHKHILFS